MNSKRLCVAGVAVLVLVAGATLLACSRPPKGTFATPEEAVQAIAEIAEARETTKIQEIFGPDATELFESGDEDADREDAQRVRAMILEKVAFDDVDETTKVALLGNDAWPFSIPLTLTEGRWRFETALGREELLTRRIGRNELLVLASLHAYVDAQNEYASIPRDGKPAAYARRFISSEGTQDGLYWPAAEGAEESPLGALLAEAAAEHAGESGPIPFNGYLFRILEAQGANASQGELSYVDEQGAMTKGFAAIAWPAKYGNSGIMSFQVNRLGVTFQKDLGADTEAVVATITAYDPDESWEPTPD
jgi:hypothetical protein